MLGTNFRDYAIVFTQLEAQEEAFSTVEVYSECAGLRPSHQPHPGQKPPTGPAPASRLPTHSPSPLQSEAGVILPGGGGRGAARGEEPWAQRAGSPAACRVLWVGFSSPQPPPGSPASPAGRTPLASQEALGRFAKWSRSLGLLSQQQAELQRDCECRQMLGRRLPA